MKTSTLFGYIVVVAALIIHCYQWNLGVYNTIGLITFTLLMSGYYHVIRGLFKEKKEDDYMKCFMGGGMGIFSLFITYRSLMIEDYTRVAFWAIPSLVFILCLIWGFNVSMYQYFKQKYPNKSMWRP